MFLHRVREQHSRTYGRLSDAWLAVGDVITTVVGQEYVGEAVVPAEPGTRC